MAPSDVFVMIDSRAVQTQLQGLSWHDNLSQWEFYCQYWRPFGVLLTDVEREGITVDVAHLRAMELKAREGAAMHEARFLAWVKAFCPEAHLINPKSTAQKQQLFFAPSVNNKTNEELPAQREFSTENADGYVEAGKSKALKSRTFTITGLGIPPVAYNASGWPSVGQAELEELVVSEGGREGERVRPFLCVVLTIPCRARI